MWFGTGIVIEDRCAHSQVTGCTRGRFLKYTVTLFRYSSYVVYIHVGLSNNKMRYFAGKSFGVLNDRCSRKIVLTFPAKAKSSLVSHHYFPEVVHHQLPPARIRRHSKDRSTDV